MSLIYLPFVTTERWLFKNDSKNVKYVTPSSSAENIFDLSEGEIKRNFKGRFGI